MDLATIIGIVAGMGVVVAAIFMGGSFSQFIDIPAILIVFGGGFAATLIRFPLSGIFNSLILGGKAAFTHRKIEPRELVDEIAQLGDTVRKNGPKINRVCK